MQAAVWIRLLTLDKNFPDLNPIAGGVQFMTVWCFIAHSLSISLDLHWLSLSVWILFNSLDQVIWLVENWKWAWHHSLLSMARVNKTGLLKRKIKVNRTIAQFHPERHWYYCPPTLVKGGYSNVFVRPYIPPSVHTSLCPSVHLSLDTILSPHSSYSFQGILMKLSSYCSYDLKMIIFYRGHAQLIFTRVIALWQFFNSKSRLCNFSCSFQWILMKPSSYCCHGLKRIILYEGHAWLLFTRVMALCQF